MAEDWRADASWKLVSYDPEAFKRSPGDRPTKRAEIATDPCWASEYQAHRIVATWLRPAPRDTGEEVG